METKKEMVVLTDIEIAHQVHLAVDDNQYLLLDTPISLEYLTDECDGIFPNAKSWCAFLRGNFGVSGEQGIYLEGDCKESTLKKWCRPTKEYSNRFVQHLGHEQYVPVDPNDLEFTFTWDANNYWSDRSKHHANGYPNVVEIYVVASLKGAQ